jgi:hypothetical protein
MQGTEGGEQQIMRERAGDFDFLQRDGDRVGFGWSNPDLLLYYKAPPPAENSSG